MIDGVIAGTGNSRLLKSPSSIPSTYEDFRAALIAGTIPIDLIFNAAGWTEQGSALSKANLLPDTLAAAWGLTSSAVPKDILLTAAARYGTSSTVAATAAKVVTLSNFALSTGAVIGVTFTNVNTSASPTLNVNSTGAIAVYVNGAAATAVQLPKFAYFQYDGTYWQLVNPVLSQIITGNYTGTGTYGYANRKTFTFTNTPKYFLVLSRNTTASRAEIMEFSSLDAGEGIGVNRTVSSSAGSYQQIYFNYSASTKTLWYYDGSNASYMLNTTSAVYDYIYIL